MWKIIEIFTFINAIFITVEGQLEATPDEKSTTSPSLDELTPSTERPDLPANDESKTGHSSTEMTEVDSDTEDSAVNRICVRPGESAFSKEDLINLVNFVADTHNIMEEINSSYYYVVKNMQEEMENNFKSYLQIVQLRPEHMNDTLNDLIASRGKIKPLIIKAAAKLKEVNPLVSEFKEADENYKRLNRKLKIANNLCKACETARFAKRSAALVSIDNVTNNIYYCDKINNTFWIVKRELLSFQNLSIKKFLNITGNYNSTYTQLINKKKIEIKKAAIKKFGTTMYDLLSLQDEYHHLKEDLETIDLFSKVNGVKNELYCLKTQLESLEEMAENYRKDCFNNCDRVYFMRSNGYVTTDDKISNTLLDQVIMDKKDNIENVLLNDYKPIFRNLDKQLNDENFIKNMLERMQPIQQNLTKAIKEESENLQILREQLPSESYYKLDNLNNDIKALFEEISVMKKQFSN